MAATDRFDVHVVVFEVLDLLVKQHQVSHNMLVGDLLVLKNKDSVLLDIVWSPPQHIGQVKRLHSILYVGYKVDGRRETILLDAAVILLLPVLSRLQFVPFVVVKVRQNDLSFDLVRHKLLDERHFGKFGDSLLLLLLLVAVVRDRRLGPLDTHHVLILE